MMWKRETGKAVISQQKCMKGITELHEPRYINVKNFRSKFLYGFAGSADSLSRQR